MLKLAKLRIAGKLYVLIAIAMLGLAAIAASGQYQLAKVFDLANYASVNTVPSFNTLNEALVAFHRMRVQAREFMLTTDEVKRTQVEHRIQGYRDSIDKALTYYQDKHISDDEDLRQLGLVTAAIKDYNQDLDVILMLGRKNRLAEAHETMDKAVLKVARVDEAFDAHLDYNRKLAAASSAEALATKARSMWMGAGITLLALAILAITGWVIGRRELADPIGTMVNNLTQLASGSLNVEITGTQRRDEVGDIARAAHVFKEFVVKLNLESWIKSNTGEIAAAVQRAEDFRSLAQVAVSKLATAIGAGHGAFYVTGEDRRYALLASYGYRERKHLSNSYAVGEGLVGQCAMEKASIMLTAPQDYIRIGSGLGEAPPACIIVLPVIHGERVLGVLEMASFQPFGEREIALLEAVLPVLATSMEILDRNLKTKELLAATQEQAERMEKQAAQLEEQQVEMEAQQAELLETENWFRSIIEAAPDGILVADAAGQILLSNPMVEEIFGYGPGELVSGSIEQLVPERIRPGHAKLRETFMAAGSNRLMSASPTLTGRRKDGSEVPLTITLAPLPPRGTRGKCVSVSVRKIES